MPETRPSGDCPNMTRGDFTQSYLRKHLLKWLIHACSISYQLYIGYRYYLYTLFISIYYIYIHHIDSYTCIVIQWCLSMYTVLSCNLHLFWLFLIIPIWWGPFIQAYPCKFSLDWFSWHAQFYAIHMLCIVQLSVAYILSFISCICLYELIAMAWRRTSAIPVLTGVAAVLRKALIVWFCAWSVCVWSLCVWVFYL